MKSSRLKKFLRWIWRVMFAIVAVVIIFILEENVRGWIMLARYKAELRAKGERLTLEELNLSIPPKEGSGSAELLAAAKELSTLQKDRRLYDLLAATRLRWASPGRVIVRCQQADLGVRKPGAPATQSLFRIRSALAEDEEVPATNPVPQANWGWGDLAEQVSAASNALAHVRGALSKNEVAFPIDYSQGFDIRLQHLGEIRGIRDWLPLAVLHEVRAGDLEAASENVMAIVCLAQLQKDERLPISQTGRLMTANVGLQVTWEALQAEGWAEQQLAKLQESWQRAQCLPDLVPSLEMDRVTHLQVYNRDTLKDLFDALRFSRYPEQRPDWADVVAYICSHLGFKSYWWPGLEGSVEDPIEYRLDELLLTAHWLIWRAAWFDQDQLRALHRWQENLDAARAVARQKSWMAWSVERERFWLPYDLWRYLRYGAVYPCDRVMQQAAQYETLREMTIAAIALKRCQLRTGTLPASLSALVPEYLPQLPHDWMDGKPLRYKLNADGTFTLYSVGNDGRDDGGNPNPTEPRRLISKIWDGRDAVWPQPATTDDAGRAQ